MPRGGKREGAGRKAGSKNKNTTEIQELAKAHAPSILQMFADIALSTIDGRPTKKGQPPAYRYPEEVRIKAGQELLNRGYGRPVATTQLTGAEGGAIAIDMNGATPEQLEAMAAKLLSDLEDKKK